MKVVYFISSYQRGGPQRLVRTLRAGDPGCEIVVHHDVFQSPVDEESMRAAGVRLVTSDHPMVWGDLSLETVRWRVFREVLRDVTDFDWIVLLSEQDYPVVPLVDVRSVLRTGGWDAVIDAVPLDRIPDRGLRRECRRRYGYSYVVLPRTGLHRVLGRRTRHVLHTARRVVFEAANRVQPLLRFKEYSEALDLPARVGVRRRFPGYRAGFTCWYGSAWYALSRAAVAEVVDFLDREPGFVRYAARTIIPVESATQSVVLNSPRLRTRTASLHHIRFSDPAGGRPDVITEADLGDVLGSGALFARKFAAGDPRTLDLVDAAVHHRSTDTLGGLPS